MAFLVLAMTIERLHAAGRHGDAARLALHAGVYDVGLIFVASLALEQRRIYLAAAIAVALETGLMFLGRKEDPSIMVMSAAAMGMMGVAVAYASSRALALVRAVVEEHRRRGGSAAISRRRLPRVSSSAAISPPWARGTRYHPVQRPQGLYSAQRAARGRAGRAARRG
jgi:hypothetical protein